MRIIARDGSDDLTLISASFHIVIEMRRLYDHLQSQGLCQCVGLSQCYLNNVVRQCRCIHSDVVSILRPSLTIGLCQLSWNIDTEIFWQIAESIHSQSGYAVRRCENAVQADASSECLLTYILQEVGQDDAAQCGTTVKGSTQIGHASEVLQLVEGFHFV